MKDLKQRVIEALNEIRPFLISDSGDVELVDIKDNKVFIKFTGNCSSCNINVSTLKLGIENTVKNHAPEIEEVINVEN